MDLAKKCKNMGVREGVFNMIEKTSSKLHSVSLMTVIVDKTESN